MSTEVLQRRFGAMGARLRLAGPLFEGTPRLDVAGDVFELRFTGGRPVGVDVVDVRGRHLLLLVRDGAVKSKFLCGHDERQWFVAAVPESEHWVSGVVTAMQALRPPVAEAAVVRAASKRRHRRRKASYVRQGEWFFVPASDVDPPALQVLRNEPISRGGGSTPHVLQEAFRTGGELVYVGTGGRVLSAERFEKLSREARNRENWNVMTRDADVFARGAVRHPDHATVVLNGWHRVAMNTEQSARAMRHVTFLD